MTDQQRSRHTKFDLGMIRDIASWELPEGATYDAVDCLCDYAGKIRKRGGTTSPAAGNSAATVEHVLGYKSNGTDGTTALYGSLGKGGANVNTFASGTGASTNRFTSGSANSWACRPFQFGNYVVSAFQSLDNSGNSPNLVVFAGGSTGTAFTATAATITANDNRITAIAPTSLVAAHVGALIELDSLGGTGHVYIGRIIEVTSSSAVRVEPTPTSAFTATQGRISIATNFNGAGGGALFNASLGNTNAQTGRYGVSFQNRMVFGYTLDFLGGTVGIAPQPNRVTWSQLPTEGFPVSGVTPDGEVLLYPGLNTAYNYVDVPQLGGMTGLAAAGDGQLVIFGPRSTFRLSGQLATETVQNNQVSFSVDQISNNIGCVSAKSIQYARGGLIWAGYDNLYEYDGSSLKPLLNGRNQRYFQDRLRAGDTIYGSAYALNRNHYYLSMSGTDGGLMFNLDTLAMTRFTNVQLFDSTPDPADATKLWGVRWWDTTGAAPTMTKGQLIGLESIWLPTSANKTDADGTAVLADVQTASYVNGPSITNTKMTTDAIVSYDLRGSGSPTVTVKADSKLNTSDASYVTVTSTLPNTGSVASSQRLDTGSLLPDGPAIETRFTMNASANSFELLSLDFGTQQRPEQFGAV